MPGLGLDQVGGPRKAASAAAVQDATTVWVGEDDGLLRPRSSRLPEVQLWRTLPGANLAEKECKGLVVVVVLAVWGDARPAQDSREMGCCLTHAGGLPRAAAAESRTTAQSWRPSWELGVLGGMVVAGALHGE